MFIEIFLLIQVALIPIYIKEFNLSLLQVSTVATIPSFVQLLMTIPAGFLADRFSTKHLLFTSIIIEGFSALFIGQTNNFVTLVFAVCIMKIASPLYHVSGLSQISKHVSPEKISKSMGFCMALGNLGSALGTLSLAVFLSTLGWRWTYFFWAIPVFLWGLIIFFFFKDDLKKGVDERKKRSVSTKTSLIFTFSFIVFLISINFRIIGTTGVQTFMTTYLVGNKGFSEATASLIFGLGPFVGILGSLIGGYSGERLGEKKALSLIMLGGLISLLLLAFTSQIYVLGLLYLVYAFFNYSVWTPINTIVASITPITERGLSYSVYFFTEGVVNSFTPTIAAGFIALTSTIWTIFPFSILFILIGMMILQFLPYRNMKQHDK